MGMFPASRVTSTSRTFRDTLPVSMTFSGPNRDHKNVSNGKTSPGQRLSRLERKICRRIPPTRNTSTNTKNAIIVLDKIAISHPPFFVAAASSQPSRQTAERAKALLGSFATSGSEALKLMLCIR